LLLIEATGFWKLGEGLRQGFENFSAYIILPTAPGKSLLIEATGFWKLGEGLRQGSRISLHT